MPLLKKKGQKGKRVTKKKDTEVEYVGSVEPDQLFVGTEPENTRPDLTEKRANDEEPDGENTEREERMNDEHEDMTASEKEKGPDQPKVKKQRGPTKMKHIAKDRNARERLDFTDMGEPCGPGSVTLSSYLGPLVREHVPYTIDDWRTIGEELKTLLWRSVQARFEVDEYYQKVAVLKQMGCLWRASKSRLVSDIKNASNNQERMQLRPKNIPPNEWRKFVKIKTSVAFKAVSDTFKEKRRRQIPHTCSRKGMVRLAEDMKKESDEPSNVTRLKVWVKSRTKKDGTPVNTAAAEKIRKATEIGSDTPSSSTHPKEDLLTQVLGPDNPGRMRAMGRTMTMSKLACYQVKSNTIANLQETQVKLQRQVQDLEDALRTKNSTIQTQVPDQDGENSAQISVNKKSQPKCVLFDWSADGDGDDDDDDEIIAEGRLFSSDPDEFVNDIPLGPISVKVLVETVTKPGAFLWRPGPNMSFIDEAVGQMIAWSASHCVLSTQMEEEEDIASEGPSTDFIGKCKLMDLATNDVVVAEGRWESKDKQALVNGLPLGPRAVKVFVDVVQKPHTFLWRPTSTVRNLEQSLKSFVAWPLNRVVFETTTETPISDVEKYTATPLSPIRKSTATPQSPLRKSQRINPEKVDKVNQKCLLMDISGKKRVIGEGRWGTNIPETLVHFVPLGPNAVQVWVDIVKIKDIKVWRPCSEFQVLDDAIGSSIAWPEDKVVLV